MIYPWQMTQWQQFWRQKNLGRLPHALLLTGIAGTGKSEFAIEMAHALLCEQVSPEGMACRKCHACRLIQGDVHPNVLRLTPEKEGQAIKVDQVRAASEFVFQTSMRGRMRVVIIHPADNLNLSAANALLKTLEEPAPDSLIILVSDHSGQLPATVLSRCQQLLFPRPPAALAMPWLIHEINDSAADPVLLLRLTGGAPLAASRLLKDNKLAFRQSFYQSLIALSEGKADLIQCASQCQDEDSLKLVDLFSSWMVDLLKLHLNGAPDQVTNTDYAPALSALSNKIARTRVSRLTEFLTDTRRQLCEGINLNKTLIAENLLFRWVECVT